MNTLKVAVLGFGNAGKAFADIILRTHDEIVKEKNTDVKVVAITTGSKGGLLDMDGIDLKEALRQVNEEGKFNPSYPAYSKLSSMEVVNTVDYDVVLELTPINIVTAQPATDHIKGALIRGKHAVSANKGPIARYYKELKELAQKNHACLFFETTVMAGTPVFDMADHCLQFCKIDRIEAILNATTNYILKEMGKGVSRDEIFRAGKEQGFMEADPSMDTEGWDATCKLTVLMNVLMGADLNPDLVDRTGIMEITPEDIEAARSRGNVIKLMCRGVKNPDGTFTAKVAPEEIPDSAVFADEKMVAVVSLYTDLMGKLTMLQYGLETTQTGYGVFIDTMRVIDAVYPKAL